MADLPPGAGRRPLLEPGQLLQLMAMGAAIVAAFSVLRADVSGLKDLAGEAGQSRAALEVRIRRLETDTAVSAERYAQLLATLEAMRATLDRLERRDRGEGAYQ